jgi:hypothetical protein
MFLNLPKLGQKQFFAHHFKWRKFFDKDVFMRTTAGPSSVCRFAGALPL